MDDLSIEQFALTSASYTMVRLLQRFDKCENMETPVGGRIRFQHGLSVRSGTGAVVRLREARPTVVGEKVVDGEGEKV